MCRLFALKGGIGDENLKFALEQFRRQAELGKVFVGSEKGHKDGWGLVVYRRGKIFLHKRSHKNAFKDIEYGRTEKQIIKISGELVIGHLRKASKGEKNKQNTHPFVYKNFSFCQNGTVFKSEKIKVKNKYKNFIKGTTDSERLFYFFLGEMKEKLTKKIFERAKNKIRARFDYTAMNMIFSDGKKLVALRDVNLDNKNVQEKKMENYYSLFLGEDKEGKARIISSEKMKIKGIRWGLMKNGEIIEIR